MADLNLAISEHVTQRLFEKARDALSISHSDSADFGPFSVSYSVGARLENGSLEFQSNGTVLIKNVVTTDHRWLQAAFLQVQRGTTPKQVADLFKGTGDGAFVLSGYAGGDTMNVAVTARSAGLLTLNVFTDRLVASQTQDVTAGTANLKMVVGRDWGTGAYMVATLRRPLDAPAERMPGRAIGVQWFSIDKAAHLLTVDLKPAATMRPNATMTVPIEIGGLAPNEDARVVVAVTPGAESSHGRDDVAILLAPHPGSEPRPVARSASGGELSRIMLAIEVVIAGVDPVPTFVFDEVDAGIGGAAAIEVGRRLARLAEASQVIAVTHLAQVAAFASNHLTVVKASDGSVTASDVRRPEGADREAEMARLLSGMPDSDAALTHARELLGLRTEAG